jgi:arsenate reductase
VLPNGLLRLRPVELSPRLLRRQLLLKRDRTVLFVCVENAGRSLMAEAFFNADPPPGWRAVSAGTEPARHANPRTGPMLREVGVDPPDHLPRLLTPELIDGAELRFTMGCLDRDSCPAHLKSRPLEDWQLPDPALLDDAGFRSVRDEIRRRVIELRQRIETDRLSA